MEKQEKYRKKYKEINPKWEDSGKIFRKMVLETVDKDTRILDVGCGHSNLLQESYEKTPHTYGIDPETDVIHRNPFIKDIRTEFVEKMSFEDNFFDVVVSAWVLEHLANPHEAFSEIYRVLKPGGVVIFLTPNVWNYNVWLIRLIPERFHSFFTKKLYGRQDNDTFPKEYKINSLGKIRKVLSSIGFEEEELLTNGDPSYISFNTFTFKIAVFLEKILNMCVFNNSKVHIIGKFKKK